VPQFDLTHVRHDHYHCLAPGLFSTARNEARKSGKLDVVYEFSGGNRIEFSGPELLGVTELRVLQGLVAMAGPAETSLELPVESPSPLGTSLRSMLELKGYASNQSAIAVKSSLRKLAYEIGLSNTRDTNTIRAAIERLWKVSVIAQINGRRAGFRLLANYSSNSRDGSLFVALNPFLTNAVLGNGRHVRIPMGEIRKIRDDRTRLVHQWLCAWVDSGKCRQVSLARVSSVLYPDPCGPETHRKRLTRSRKALLELNEIGWQAKEYAKQKFTVKRP